MKQSHKILLTLVGTAIIVYILIAIVSPFMEQMKKDALTEQYLKKVESSMIKKARTMEGVQTFRTNDAVPIIFSYKIVMNDVDENQAEIIEFRFLRKVNQYTLSSSIAEFVPKGTKLTSYEALKLQKITKSDKLENYLKELKKLNEESLTPVVQEIILVPLGIK